MSAQPVFDLHTHSTFSDGDLSPTELVARAARAGVSVMALTDHDAVGGVKTARQAAGEHGMQLVAGVELSARWQSLDVHIVGLGIDEENKILLDRLAGQAKKRVERAERIGYKLGQLLRSDDIHADVLARAGDRPPGRPDFAAVLIARGWCRTFDDAFRKYLAQGKPAYVKIEWPQLSEAIAWIHDAGGQAVLAHPGRYKLTRSRLTSLIAEFQKAGGDAMEVVTSGQDANKTLQLANLAVRHGLLASAGSDYHGPKMPWAALGRYPPMPQRCMPVWQGWQLD